MGVPGQRSKSQTRETDSGRRKTQAAAVQGGKRKQQTAADETRDPAKRAEIQAGVYENAVYCGTRFHYAQESTLFPRSDRHGNGSEAGEGLKMYSIKPQGERGGEGFKVLNFRGSPRPDIAETIR